ncbi:MAG: hypothetical protein AVDCRST_MAG52-763 [uncultured Blastococcus sp.]|uniref:Uncharacterized protein n=1 Tax=uncultured Blastococcus sp. TaxID=217144 RepID=A0A6J4HIZ5_9ACTN|nr:MAG: hypothetical protein AVDCRST_MAG52-763 [uncultured Blastococcus sp.]
MAGVSQNRCSPCAWFRRVTPTCDRTGHRRPSAGRPGPAP